MRRTSSQGAAAEHHQRLSRRGRSASRPKNEVRVVDVESDPKAKSNAEYKTSSNSSFLETNTYYKVLHCQDKRCSSWTLEMVTTNNPFAHRILNNNKCPINIFAGSVCSALENMNSKHREIRSAYRDHTGGWRYKVDLPYMTCICSSPKGKEFILE